MTSEVIQLTEEMERLSTAILLELTKSVKELDGKAKDIGNGTHIKIPMDVGYVSLYKSMSSLSKNYEISVWFKKELNPEVEDRVGITNVPQLKNT